MIIVIYINHDDYHVTCQASHYQDRYDSRTASASARLSMTFANCTR
jgi:hypothetical protein